jgi:hypothetical protein
MPLVVKDRVRETSTSTGTGDIILNGAVQAFQDFSVIGDGNTTYYTIVDATTGAFEVGIGTYTLATTTLSRDTVLESSNAGAAVNFAANVKDVFVTYPAERAVYGDAGNVVSGYTISGGSINNTPIGATTPSTVASTNLSYTGTLTGSTGVINIGSGQVYKDASGFVGIGTSTNSGLGEKLQVSGSTVVTNLLSSTAFCGTVLKSSTTTGFGRYIGAEADAMTFGRYGVAENMRIDASGNVGIGTTDPSTYGVDGSENLVIGQAAGNAGLTISSFNTSTGTIAFSDVVNGSVGRGYVTYNHSGDSMAFGTVGAERLRITSTGNVGIGRTAPVGKLEVNGSIVSSIGDTTGFGFNRAGVYRRALSLDGVDDLRLFNELNNDLLLGTNNTERLRINNAGNVGIGTSSPLGKLKVLVGDNAPAASGDMNTGVIYESGSGSRAINFGVNNTAGYSWINAAFSNNSGVADTLVLMTGATEQARIDASGNFKFNSGYGSAATAYGCRAWVNFDGTGTVAIRASGNVSSITDNGTGDYTVNFTTAMPDANYACVAGYTTPAWGAIQHAYTYTTSNVRIEIATPPTPTYIDASTVTVVIFR